MAENKIRETIEAAGVVYPINWAELSSSAKDMWEERMLRSIHRQEHRAALANLTQTFNAAQAERGTGVTLRQKSQAQFFTDHGAR